MVRQGHKRAKFIPFSAGTIQSGGRVILMGTSQSSGLSTQFLSLRSKHTEPQVLTSYQKVILRTAWRHMSKQGQSNCGNTIMRRLFIRNERIKNIFCHKTTPNEGFKAEEMHNVQQHYKEIVEFLQFVISNLDYPSRIAKRCLEIGHLHRKYKAVGMKTEHWDLLGESITETIREYQGWKRHRESLRAANILVSFLIDRIRTGFLQRDVATPSGTPPNIARAEAVTPDRERSKSLQESFNGLLARGWTDSCPSIKNSISPIPPRRKIREPKRSLPCMSISKEKRLEVQIHQRRRCLPQTPPSDDTISENDNATGDKKRQQFRRSNSSFEVCCLNK